MRSPRSRLSALTLLACLAGTAAATPQPDSLASAAEDKAEALEAQAAPPGGDVPRPAPGEALSPSEARALDPEGEKPLDDPLTCLARSIYWEARGEPEAGMRAIASVVMNRLGHEGFPDTVCAVVTEGSEQGACQFSWWCDGRADEADEAQAYDQAREFARQALNGELPDETGGALYFHHRRVAPAWADHYPMTAELGDHLFYRPQGGAAR